jgi:hypothetical protein
VTPTERAAIIMARRARLARRLARYVDQDPQDVKVAERHPEIPQDGLFELPRQRAPEADLPAQGALFAPEDLRAPKTPRRPRVPQDPQSRSTGRTGTSNGRPGGSS